MAWIESHQSLGTHLKLKRLARELRIHRAQAIGHLQYLWWWALDNAPTGNLSALAPAEISECSEWTGEAEPYVGALKRCGWLDDDGMIHDWEEYAGKVVLQRAKDRQRKRDERAADRLAVSTRHPPDIPRTGEGQNKESVHTIPYPTEPNPTGPRTNRRFARPTSEELSLEAAKTGLPEAEMMKFVAYYESNGWRVGKNPMRSWRGAMAGWKVRWEENRNGNRNTQRSDRDPNRFIGGPGDDSPDVPFD